MWQVWDQGLVYVEDGVPYRFSQLNLMVHRVPIVVTTCCGVRIRAATEAVSEPTITVIRRRRGRCMLMLNDYPPLWCRIGDSLKFQMARLLGTAIMDRNLQVKDIFLLGMDSIIVNDRKFQVRRFG